jgi:lipoprotein NlpI
MNRAGWGFLGVAVAGMIFSSVPAGADKNDCLDLSGDAAIEACTRDINSGRYKGHDLAVAYYNRGVEYDGKQDVDRAIADYSQAISIDPKYAVAYNNRGNMHSGKGDVGRAIADFSQAISLDPKYAMAYYNRGNSYSLNGDSDRAIADYSRAISIDPKYKKAYYNRGDEYDRIGNYDRAVADFNQAIGLDPKYTKAYTARGRLNLYAGFGDKALADFTQANAIDPKNPSAALWIDIVGRRNNLPSRLAQTSSQLDMTRWPAPVIRLFLDQLTPAAVLAAADDPDPTEKKGRICEANFFTGELSLLKGSKAEATRLFRLAASDCPVDFAARFSARAELKALGVAP